MTTIQIQIEDEILREAEKALHSIGMDIQIAVNVFLRRVAIEKGLPMSMNISNSSSRVSESVLEYKDLFEEGSLLKSRSNNAITKKMAEEVWEAFMQYHKGLGEISRLSDDIAESTGMNRGSAFIYLNILANLVKGEANTRTMKMKDLEFYMEKIKEELGIEKYKLALKSLEISVPYWKEKLAGNFGDKIEVYCEKHSLTDIQ